VAGSPVSKRRYTFFLTLSSFLHMGLAVLVPRYLVPPFLPCHFLPLKSSPEPRVLGEHARTACRRTWQKQLGQLLSHFQNNSNQFSPHPIDLRICERKQRLWSWYFEPLQK